jgi:hypothetical protein
MLVQCLVKIYLPKILGTRTQYLFYIEILCYFICQRAELQNTLELSVNQMRRGKQGDLPPFLSYYGYPRPTWRG